MNSTLEQMAYLLGRYIFGGLVGAAFLITFGEELGPIVAVLCVAGLWFTFTLIELGFSEFRIKLDQFGHNG